jgi:hypothetical protein
MDIFRYATPIIYWLLILLWSFIFIFYLRRIFSGKFKNRLTIVLMIILTIEAFRTLFESVYFGAWYTSLSGMIPGYIHKFLIRPQMVMIPKSLNLIAAALIILILIRKWIPHEGREIEELDEIVRDRTKEIVMLNISLEERIKERTRELEDSNRELKNALLKIKNLRGLIPICAQCKKVRDDEGYWEQIEKYISEHSDADFSHGICPDCLEKLYGNMKWYRKNKKNGSLPGT